MVTFSNILAWEIPWIEELAGYRTVHDLVTKQTKQTKIRIQQQLEQWLST